MNPVERLLNDFPEEQAPPIDTPSRASGANGAWRGLEAWLAEYSPRIGLEISGPRPKGSGREWRFLRGCPFQRDYADANAAVFEGADGKVGFHCFCGDHGAMGWKELRQLVEGPKEQRKQRQQTPPQQPRPRIIRLDELRTMELQKPTFIIEKIVTKPGAWSMIGSHKAGKTLLAGAVGLSYHAGVPFLDYYATLESRGVLFIEQDDPAGLATIRQIVDRSPIPKNPAKFFTVDNANFTIGPDLVLFLQEQIRSLDLGLIVLDSYTRMRPSHTAGGDIVKIEANAFGLLDALAKKTDCVILILHHRSRGNAALDWSERAAGTFAVGASTEGEIHISRFPELPSTAPERLVQIRGRRLEGLELVIRFRRETLDYEFVLEGAAATAYPSVLEIQRAFGKDAFTPKDLYHQTGIGRASANRLIAKLSAAGVLGRCGYGQYKLTEAP